MAEHTVTEVLSDTHHREYITDNGHFYCFKVKTDSGEVAEVSKVKPETPPKVGDKYKTFAPAKGNKMAALYGPISDFKDSPQSGSQPRSYASSASVRDDPVQILIVRQSSIKAAVEMLEGDRSKTEEEHARGLEDWIAWFENKTWESVGGTPASSTGTADGPAEGSSSSGNGGEPSGAPSAIDLLKARLEYKVDPDTFSMLVTSVGAESVQGATEEQRAEIMAQLAGLAA